MPTKRQLLNSVRVVLAYLVRVSNGLLLSGILSKQVLQKMSSLLALQPGDSLYVVGLWEEIECGETDELVP